MIATGLGVIGAELALFAATGFLLFALDDLAVDLIFFARSTWRTLVVYRRYPRAFADQLIPFHGNDTMAVLIPAWDEAAVIGPMLRHTLGAFDHPDYRLYVGHYRNDPATAAAIADIADRRVVAVPVAVDGPTTKADCLNHLYHAMDVDERLTGRRAVAVVLHDAEDVVHPLELRLFASLSRRAGLVQLPVTPLPDPDSRWISGHYCDEFAESHAKELVVREAVGASIPLAGVGCSIARGALDALARAGDGSPFAAASQTEDYELGLRLGAIGYRTMFVRIPSAPGHRGVVTSRGHFPTHLDAAVRQKARWIGGIALAGWDRLGWRGGWGERWFRMRDRRGPLAAVLLAAGYAALVIWLQFAVARGLGATLAFPVTPLLAGLLWINGWLLAWRVVMRALCTGAVYGVGEGLRSIPRLVVANVVAMLAVRRAFAIHRRGGPTRWDKTAHVFPSDLSASDLSRPAAAQ